MEDSTDNTITFHDLWNVWFRWKTPYQVTELPVQFNLLPKQFMHNFTQLSVVSSWKQQRVFSSSLTHHFCRRILVNLMPSRHNKDIDVTTTRKRKRLCSVCGQEGHDRRSCRSAVEAERNSDIDLEQQSTPPLGMMKEPTSKPNEHTKMMLWYYHNLVIVCIVF